MKLPLRTLVVDDEKSNACVLVKRLREFYSDIFSVSDDDIAYSYKQALLLLKANSYDISILDIVLDTGKCFKLFEEIDRTHLGIVVYTTIFEKHTNKELSKINPHFFIDKPANIYDLCDFVFQLRVHLSKLKDFESLPDHYKLKDDKNNIIAVREDDIYYLQSSSNYTIIYFIKNNLRGKSIIRATLKEVHELFPAHKFWRIERSFVVNNSKVHRYTKPRGDKGDVLFQNSVTFDVDIKNRICYSNNFLNQYLRSMAISR